MKTIIKIVLALAILNAAAQAGLAALANYQFQDAVHEALIFAPNSTDEQITDEVVSLAKTQGLPLEPNGISVKQVGPDLIVNITYETDVTLVPGIYTRSIRFNPSASTRLMPGVRRSPLR